MVVVDSGDDLSVLLQVFVGGSVVVFFEPVFHWAGVFLDVHRESPTQGRRGRTNVVVITRPTILVGASVFVNYVCAIRLLGCGGAVLHDKLTCLSALVVYVDL